jgi:hypothetical protein
MQVIDLLSPPMLRRMARLTLSLQGRWSFQEPFHDRRALAATKSQSRKLT